MGDGSRAADPCHAEDGHLLPLALAKQRSFDRLFHSKNRPMLSARMSAIAARRGFITEASCTPIILSAQYIIFV